MIVLILTRRAEELNCVFECNLTNHAFHTDYIITVVNNGFLCELLFFGAKCKVVEPSP